MLGQFEYTAYNLFYIPNPRSAQLACEWLDTTMGPSEQREFKLIKQFNKACKVPGRAR